MLFVGPHTGRCRMTVGMGVSGRSAMSDKELRELYPDLEVQGGVANALKQSLRSLGSALIVTGLGVARVEQNRRFSQIYTAAHERLFLYDFWDRGVMLADARTPDLDSVAKSVHAWVEDRVTMTQLRATFAFVVPAEIAEAFENDAEAEWKWSALEEAVRGQDHMSDLLPLVIEAKKRAELRNLFPYASHDNLCLSRCTGYPYSGDCPYAIPEKAKDYSVFDRRGKPVGQGDAARAVQLLIDHLPPGFEKAKKGTRDDL